ncbi:MAG: glycoside hydrolase family 25 protein [Clostridiales Family XIII bacterium]|jgi:GH25 family lysozyme M1 (1,4-beta-N-acetylmuramidase)|nr:glycoside hydrolase family 25 protein [Clostridiales Family XIII bacterium]
MEEERSIPEKRSFGLIIILVFTNLFFLTALIWLLLHPQPLNTPLVSEDGSLSGIESTGSAVSREEIVDELAAEGWVSPEILKASADEFNLSTELLSRFFKDKIIYKDAGQIYYDDIDPGLKPHPYNWANLNLGGKRPVYIQADGSQALLGIDVSRYQEEIDWAQVAGDGISFAMIRMGYRGYGNGSLNTDEYFAANISGASAAGLRTGVYFFSQAITSQEAVEEADAVLAAIAGYNVSFPIVFDMEEISGAKARTDSLTKEDVTAIAAAFCERIRRAGYTPMIYANPKWFVSRMSLEQLEDYDKWLAQYYKTPAFPYEFSIWQFSSTGSVAGIKGNVDMNLAFVDYASAS